MTLSSCDGHTAYWRCAFFIGFERIFRMSAVLAMVDWLMSIETMLQKRILPKQADNQALIPRYKYAC